MEWIFLILAIVFLVVIFLENRALWQLVYSIQGERGGVDRIAEIGEQLKKIYQIMDGDEKMKAIIKKRREALKKRLIKQLVVYGRSQPDAERETNQIFKDATEELGESEYEVDYGFENTTEKLLSLEKWVIERERNTKRKNKYGHLLGKARRFIRGKPEITEDGLEKALNTDWTGVQWVLEQLEFEKKVENVKEWDSKLELYGKTDRWKVLT